MKIATFLSALVLLVVSLTANALESVKTPAHLYYPLMNTVAGNPKGEVTVVEFFDYHCDFCYRTYTNLEALLKINPDVRVVFRDFPIMDANSQLASRAGLAAQAFDKYHDMHTQLFKQNNFSSEEWGIIKLAKEIGIGSDDMKAAMLSNTIGEHLQQNVDLAKSLHIRGVPVVFVAVTPQGQQRSVIAYKLIAPSLEELQTAVAAASRMAQAGHKRLASN